MPIKRAVDIMIPLDSYPYVAPDCSLRDAIALIEDTRFDIESASRRMSLPRVLLVIDEQDGLVGSVRRRDIMRGLEPGFLQTAVRGAKGRVFVSLADPNLAELSWDHLQKQMRARADRKVSEVMKPIVVAVNADEHIFKVVEAMVDNDVSLVPVLSGGQVVGVVRSVDLLHEIAQVVLDPEDPAQG